jgi:hypothetical protein
MTLFSIRNEVDDEVASNVEVSEPKVNLKRRIDEVCSDDDSEYSEGSSASEDFGVSDDEMVEESVKEIEDRHKVSSAVDDYGSESMIFTEADLEAWKSKEKALHNRFKNGYYRCKIKNSGMYKEILDLYSPYVTEEALRMLHHPYHTQRNEAMNQSVSSFAPKGKTYSCTESLDARVMIAAGIQILGYEEFWKQIFEEFSIPFDDNLAQYLRQMQNKKDAKKAKSKTKEGKTKRSKQKLAKMSDEHAKDMAAQKEGCTYESGIAMKHAQRGAKQTLTASKRNPKGTPKSKMRCKYWHEQYCTTYGHSSSKSNECFMFRKSKAERDAASQAIMDDCIERELQKFNESGE